MTRSWSARCSAPLLLGWVIACNTPPGTAVVGIEPGVPRTLDDLAGNHVAIVGDVDGDGRDDVALSAIGQDSGGSAAGAVYLFTQAPTGTMSCSTSDAVFIGESAADSAGFVAPAGDADADGLADILVGAPYNAAGGAGAGASHLLLAEGL